MESFFYIIFATVFIRPEFEVRTGGTSEKFDKTENFSENKIEKVSRNGILQTDSLTLKTALEMQD